jgi:hypothetical protein
MFDTNPKNVAARRFSRDLNIFHCSYPHLNLSGHFGFLGRLGDAVKEFKRRGEVELSSERGLIGCR